MKKVLSFLLAVLTLTLCAFGAQAEESAPTNVNAFVSQGALALAYCNLDDVPETMHDSVIDARNEIIYAHPGWVADGSSGAIFNVITGETIRELPEFHEVFPEDWEYPIDTSPVEPADTVEVSSVYSNKLYKAYDVYLKKFSGSDSGPFDTVPLGTDYSGIYAYASSLTSSETYNIGFKNAATGASLGFGNKLVRNEGIVWYKPLLDKSAINVAVRASTHSIPGHSIIEVYRDYSPTTTVSDRAYS